MGSIKKATKKDYNRGLVNRFLKEVAPDEWEMKDVARWAIENDLWDEPPQSKIARCAKEFSDACREEYHRDAQGRQVRSKHHYAVTRTDSEGRKIQRHFWADYRTMSRRQAELSFGQRRKQIEGECVQLSTDVDSYNDNTKNDHQMLMSFDFTHCVNESGGNGEYDPS